MLGGTSIPDAVYAIARPSGDHDSALCETPALLLAQGFVKLLAVSRASVQLRHAEDELDAPGAPASGEDAIRRA